MLKVGIPRALLYYKYFPMWSAFLKKIGAEVVVSETTNRQIISQGASRVVTDTCLPVKVFIGHVVSLVGGSDFILIPVVRSTREKVYNCSRFLGLPDMTRAVVPEAQAIIDIEFDLNRRRGYLYQQIYRLGQNFAKNPIKIKDAAQYAWTEYLRYKSMMLKQNLTRVEAIEMMHNPMLSQVSKQSMEKSNSGMTIGLAGHPYVLHDGELSHRLIDRLRFEGIDVLMPEMVPPEMQDTDDSNSGVAGLADRYWESEEDMIDAGDFYIKNKVDGIIGMMAFGCGPDSLMMHLVQRRAQDANIPFMCLTVEEHTAEAGIVTRLEAFLDMIHRRTRVMK